MNLSKNIREYEAKQKSEIILDHEISDLKAELQKIEQKISLKKEEGGERVSKKLGSVIGAKEVQEDLKSKNMKIEKLKSAYSSLLTKWQTGVEARDGETLFTPYSNDLTVAGKETVKLRADLRRSRIEIELNQNYRNNTHTNFLKGTDFGAEKTPGLQGHKNYAEKYLSKIDKDHAYEPTF